MKKETPRANVLEPPAPRERATPQTLSMPDFLTAVGLKEGFWGTLPLYVKQAAWIGGKGFLETFVEGEEWDEDIAARALGEACVNKKRGLVRWEPFLEDGLEEDPIRRFKNGLVSPKAQLYWQGLEVDSSQTDEAISRFPLRVWLAARALVIKDSWSRETEDVEHDTLAAVAGFLAILEEPEKNVFHLPELDAVVGEELARDPFGASPGEILKGTVLDSGKAEEVIDFFQGCSPREWALLRSLAYRSFAGHLSFWRNINLLRTEDSLGELRRLNAWTLRRLGEAFGRDNLIPPSFLDLQAQRLWPHLSQAIQNQFGPLTRTEMRWLRGGGTGGHFKLPWGIPSDSLILLMSGHFFAKGEEIFQGIGAFKDFVRGMVVGPKRTPPEGEWSMPKGLDSEGAAEMRSFALPAGIALHDLFFGVYSRKETIEPSDLEIIRQLVNRIRALTGERFTNDRLRREGVYETTLELQEKLKEILRTKDDKEDESIFKALDLREGKADTERKGAVAIRATVVLANEVLNPTVKPDDVSVLEPLVLVKDQEGVRRGWEIPDVLVIKGLGGEALDPKGKREKWAAVKSYVASFPRRNFFPLRGLMDFCDLMEGLKKEFGVSSVWAEFVELKPKLGQRLNRSPGQLSKLHKQELNMAIRMSLMAAVAWQARAGKVDRQDIPSIRLVYLRPYGSQVIPFAMRLVDFDQLSVGDAASGGLTERETALVAAAIKSFQIQVEEGEKERGEAMERERRGDGKSKRDGS